MTKKTFTEWFTGAARKSTKTGLKFVTPAPGVALRTVVGEEAARLGVAPRSMSVLATLKRATKASLFVSRRQVEQMEAQAFHGGPLLSLEKLRERRVSGELEYRPGPYKEQAGKQHDTRVIKAAFREPFTREALGIKTKRRARAPHYNADAFESPAAVKELLRRKIVNGEYIEPAQWHETMDWLRAHKQEELLELFRTRGVSTPGKTGIVRSGAG